MKDYRALLKRYMMHIHDCESVFYLSDQGYEPGHPANLTATEWEELEKLAAEITETSDN